MALTEIKNRNFQSPFNFDLRISRLTDFNYFVQRVNVPALALTPAIGTGYNPFTRVHWAGDHMAFGDLIVEFKIDEEMRNWYEIFSWMQALGFPEKQSQYGDLYKGELKNLDGEKTNRFDTRQGIGAIFGQASLTINTSNNNPHLTINFVDIHPVSLTEIAFDTRSPEVNYVTSVVNFKYDYFTVEKVKT
jgi:hypothetical protein